MQRKDEGECYSIPIHPSRELFFCERRRRERERELLPFSVFCTLFSIKFPSPPPPLSPRSPTRLSRVKQTLLVHTHRTSDVQTREREVLYFFYYFYIYIFYNTLPLIVICSLERGTGLNVGLKPTHYLRRPGKKEKKRGVRTNCGV